MSCEASGLLVSAEIASYPMKLKDFRIALSVQRLRCFGAVVIIIMQGSEEASIAVQNACLSIVALK